MKIGRGKLLTGGDDVSISITYDGVKRQVCVSGSHRPEEFQIWTKGGDWRGSTSKENWTCLGYCLAAEATAEELDAIWTETQRVASDPVQRTRAAQSEKNIARAQMRQKLKAAMVRVKRALRELLQAGCDAEELEAQLSGLVRETVIEAVHDE